MSDAACATEWAFVGLLYISAEGTGYAVSARTKYVRATLNPKWNEEFNFLVGKPLNDKLAISVWDKDLAYDELIGRVNLDLVSLPLVKGHQIDKTLPVPSFLFWCPA